MNVNWNCNIPALCQCNLVCLSRSLKIKENYFIIIIKKNDKNLGITNSD